MQHLNILPNDYMMLIYNLTEDWTQWNKTRVFTTDGHEIVQTNQILTEYGICYLSNNYLTKDSSTS